MSRLDLTKGNILKTLVFLAWPAFIGVLLNAFYNVVDTIWIGRYSTLGVAATSMVFPVFFIIIALSAGISTGTASLVARYLGAKKNKEADNAAEHSILISLFFGILITAAGIISAVPLFRLLGATPEIFSMTLAYARIIFSGSVFAFLYMTLSAVLRAEGDTKTPTKVLFFTTMVNFILDPFLIFGIAGLPEMGVAGAAIATVFAQFISCVILLRHILKKRSVIRLNIRDFKFDFSIIRKTLSIGVPSSLSNVFTSIGFMFLMRIVSIYGTYAIAAYGIGIRMDAIAIMPAIALTTAVLTMVGQNIGAKKIYRAEKTAWVAAVLISIFMLFIGLLFFINPGIWIRIFTSDPEIIKIGFWYFRIISLSYIFKGFQFVMSGAFQGSGKVIAPAIVNISAWLVFAVPLAYLMAVKLGFGLIGVWIAMLMSAIYGGLANMFLFARGHWKRASL
ncbi:MATE family efflux transporter [Candidatus Woesearchaeota archaeon]|nr:MATE family efflux transporter [Candidatus Woesearchaeota archaeon]